MNFNLASRIVKTMPCDVTCLFKGTHGIGKTQFVYQLGKMLGLEVVCFMASECSDVGDIIGLPVIHEVERRIPVCDDRGKFTGKYEKVMMKTTTWAPPKWYNPEKPYLLFFDEVNRARPELSNALMRLCNEHRIGDIALPEGSRIFAAINPGDDGQYDVEAMDPAKLDRYWMTELTPTPSEWISWMTKNGGHEAVIGYIDRNPNDLDPYTNTKNANVGSSTERKLPSRRSWTKCSNWLTNAEAMNNGERLDKEMFEEGVAGFVGTSPAINFWDFYSNMKGSVSADQILTDFDAVAKEVRKFDSARTIKMVGAIHTWLESNEVKELHKENWKKFYKSLNPEVRAAVTRDLVYKSIMDDSDAHGFDLLSDDDLLNEYIELAGSVI